MLGGGVEAVPRSESVSLRGLHAPDPGRRRGLASDERAFRRPRYHPGAFFADDADVGETG